MQLVLGLLAAGLLLMCKSVFQVSLSPCLLLKEKDSLPWHTVRREENTIVNIAKLRRIDLSLVSPEHSSYQNELSLWQA